MEQEFGNNINIPYDVLENWNHSIAKAIGEFNVKKIRIDECQIFVSQMSDVQYSISKFLKEWLSLDNSTDDNN